jgi:hypothetical protein
MESPAAPLQAGLDPNLPDLPQGLRPNEPDPAPEAEGDDVPLEAPETLPPQQDPRPAHRPGFVPHERTQVAPWMDLYAPTWLHPVVKWLILDEHGPMPRTVQAQVGFGVLLMFVQFCMDMLAWVLGFRWVFVNAMGPGGWILAGLFAFLIALVIVIFERFVLTADVANKKLPIFLNPAILMRVGVVVLFATVTAIPVEMLVFHDVIQGRLNGELQGVREGARQQLRGDIRKDIEDVSGEEGKSRARLKEETPPVALENLELPQFDLRLKELSTQADAVVTDMREEEVGWRSGEKGKGRKWFRLKDQKDGLDRQMADIKAQREAELNRRQEANRKAQQQSAEWHFKELAKISDRYDPRKLDLEKKLRDVDRMTDDELTRATKREFKVVDGFARRWKIMDELEKEDPIFAWTKWGVRVVFVAFGLLVLTTKALFNRQTKAYYAGLDPMRLPRRPEDSID